MKPRSPFDLIAERARTIRAMDCPNGDVTLRELQKVALYEEVLRSLVFCDLRADALKAVNAALTAADPVPPASDERIAMEAEIADLEGHAALYRIQDGEEPHRKMKDCEAKARALREKLGLEHEHPMAVQARDRARRWPEPTEEVRCVRPAATKGQGGTP